MNLTKKAIRDATNDYQESLLASAGYIVKHIECQSTSSF